MYPKLVSDPKFCFNFLGAGITGIDGPTRPFQASDLVEDSFGAKYSCQA